MTMKREDVMEIISRLVSWTLRWLILFFSIAIFKSGVHKYLYERVKEHCKYDRQITLKNDHHKQIFIRDVSCQTDACFTGATKSKLGVANTRDDSTGKRQQTRKDAASMTPEPRIRGYIIDPMEDCRNNEDLTPWSFTLIKIRDTIDGIWELEVVFDDKRTQSFCIDRDCEYPLGWNLFSNCSCKIEYGFNVIGYAEGKNGSDIFYGIFDFQLSVDFLLEPQALGDLPWINIFLEWGVGVTEMQSKGNTEQSNEATGSAVSIQNFEFNNKTSQSNSKLDNIDTGCNLSSDQLLKSFSCLTCVTREKLRDESERQMYELVRERTSRYGRNRSNKSSQANQMLLQTHGPILEKASLAPENTAVSFPKLSAMNVGSITGLNYDSLKQRMQPSTSDICLTCNDSSSEYSKLSFLTLSDYESQEIIRFHEHGYASFNTVVTKVGSQFHLQARPLSSILDVLQGASIDRGKHFSLGIKSLYFKKEQPRYFPFETSTNLDDEVD